MSIRLPILAEADPGFRALGFCWGKHGGIRSKQHADPRLPMAGEATATPMATRILAAKQWGRAFHPEGSSLKTPTPKNNYRTEAYRRTSTTLPMSAIHPTLPL